MAHSVIMPKTGMAMEEGTVVRWLKKPGDTVTRGEPIAVIETDKVTMDLEAEDTGTLLAIVRGDGAVVRATDTIAWIGAPGETVDAAATGAASPPPGAPAAVPAAVPAAIDASVRQTAPAFPAAPGRVPATPAARRLAAETGIPLFSIKGTGPGGSVRLRDVTAPAADIRPFSATGSAPAMTGMRKAIAEKMMRSHQTVPAVTLITRADITELAALREKINESGRPHVSFTDFVVRAAATALREHPLINSTLRDDRVVPQAEVAIGVAVALESGLIVPVIRAADTLTVREVSDRLRDLAARARRGSLSAEECSGGTFTITNLGMYGITEFTPLINVPESAILGVGAAEEVLRRAPSGDIVSRRLVSLCLTHDHRHIDGVPAAAFLGRVRTLLENCWALLA
jgi:pyruvate dehydrogenase E2 component (dihydrolipoamide acetyltransferase)